MHQKKLYHTILCFVASLLVSCSWYQEEQNILDKAESLLNTRPDSTLILLDSIVYPRTVSTDFYNRYTLIQIQAKDKCDLKISGDTNIFSAKDYYLSIKDYDNAAMASAYCGRVLQEQKKRDVAMLAYIEAEEYVNKSDKPNYKLQGLIQSWIGVLYFQKIYPDEAIARYNNAISLFNKVKDHKNEALAYRSLGDALLMKNNMMDSAFVSYNKGLTIAIENKDDKTESVILNSMGQAYIKYRKYEIAFKYFRKSLVANKNEELRAYSYMGLSKVFTTINMGDSAIFYLNEAKTINSKKKNANLTRLIEKRFAEIEESNQNYKKALYHMKKYTWQLDTLVYSINEQNVIDTEKKYNYMQLKSENSQLYIERLAALITCLILFIIIIIMGFVIYWRTNKHKKALQESEMKTEEMRLLADSYDRRNLSMRNVIIEHFQIMKRAAMIESYMREEDRKLGAKFLKKFHESVFGQESFNWDKTYVALNHIYDDLVDKLKEKHSDMPEGEFKTCCLTYARLNNTEIAILVGLKLNTIQTKKYAIRKRFIIRGYGSIVKFVRLDLGLRKYDDD